MDKQHNHSKTAEPTELVDYFPEFKELYRDNTSSGSGIAFEHAAALFRHVVKNKPVECIEIGMANGVSTIAICSALKFNGKGRLISVDPYQTTQWNSQGLKRLEAASLNKYHTLMERPDYSVLPRLLDDNLRIDFGYIDGWHTFDYTLLDFWYIDKMLSEGGVVAFNDCGMRAVTKAIKFVMTHRAYIEEDVGLIKRYEASNFLKSVVRRLTDFRTNDRYFRKIKGGEPDWNFYADF